MKIAILGGTNIEKLSKYIGKSESDIEKCLATIGRILGEKGYTAVTVFNSRGVLKIVPENCVKAGGKHEMLFTKNKPR